MMQNTQEWFDYLLSSQWVVLGNNILIQPQRSEDGIWNLGHITLNDQEVAQACPSTNIQDIQEFQLIHHSWQVVAFKIYRPLIYFCAFGKNEILECVYTAIQSLIEFGKWQHDIAVFTAEDTKKDLENKLSALTFDKAIHIITVPATEKIDWYTSRYKINAHDIFRKAQPLLYLDVDIICNTPLDTLFIRLIDSPLIHTCKEGSIGEGHPESGGHWYGWRLMQEDNVSFNRHAKGFSSGAMLFSNFNIAHPLFNMIKQSAHGYIQKYGYNGVSYDQRFANYVLFKFKKVEIDIMSEWIDLYRIPQETTLTPSGHTNRGLVHFLNASIENKLITMKKYIEDLRFRAKS